MSSHRFTLLTTMARIGFLILFSALAFMEHVAGHGRLSDPPQRSSMWRFGFDTPVNWNDDTMNCGGISAQWTQNDGKCGECGDPYNLPRPRPNEDGGEYGTGVISREYEAGAAIDVTVYLMNNHKGYWEFRISPTVPEEQSSFDEHLLEFADGSGTRYYLPDDLGRSNVTLQVKLPDGLTCEHCVFQWRYYGGNNWGTCDDGTGALGCGPQETYQNCADVAIS